ncbi:MAG: YlbF family regulator [Clostridia bacterium]|nr:YlbF family regulator [Clostridia bacterium]
MEIFELAAELGNKLKEDERLKKLESARLAYETSAELQSLMSEYETQQQVLQAEVGKAEDRDMLLVETVQDRINELYKQIMTHPVFVALNEAQAAVNELMNAVNSTITMQITGEEPSGCTHNCSTCGGCH